MGRDKARPRARVLIVDDHPAVREALALRIGRQPDLEVCGEAGELAEALRLLADQAKILDIALDTGFGDVSNFDRAFRTEFGVNPRTYRIRHGKCP